MRTARPITRKLSSGSVEIYLLDKEAARANIAEAVKEMAAAHAEVERVVLFGSLARGDAVPGSDADLLVLLSRSERPFLERIARYTPGRAGMGVDVFPYTWEEFEAKSAASPRWAREIAEQGIVLFERGA